MTTWEWIHLAKREFSGSLSEWSRRAGVGRSTLTRVLASPNPNPRAGTFLKILHGAGIEVYSGEFLLVGLDEALVVLERARLSSRVTIAELAKRTGEREQRLERIFRGRATPLTWELMDLFMLLRCPLRRQPSSTRRP